MKVPLCNLQDIYEMGRDEEKSTCITGNRSVLLTGR